MNAVQALVRLGFRNRRQQEHLLDKAGKFLLSRLRHQKVPERAKVSTLIGIDDGIALTKYLIEQGTLGSLPQCDALASLPIELVEVVHDFAKIRDTFAR